MLYPIRGTILVNFGLHFLSFVISLFCPTIYEMGCACIIVGAVHVCMQGSDSDVISLFGILPGNLVLKQVFRYRRLVSVPCSKESFFYFLLAFDQLAPDPPTQQRKVIEIEAVIIQYVPDVFIISESNLREELLDHEKEIHGYREILPKTAAVQKLVRLVMLVRDGVQVYTVGELMDNEVAAVWIKIVKLVQEVESQWCWGECI